MTDPLMENRILKLRELKDRALLGGGQSRVDSQHRHGKLTARERIDLLLDPDSFEEFHQLLGHADGNPGEGVITGHGTIDGRPVCLFAQDATVRNGSMNLMHGTKIYRIMELALNMGVPLIGLNDSPGAQALRPDEPETFHHEKGEGGVFLPNTLGSGYIPQITAILGTCAGIAVYSPGLTDFICMVDGISHMFITGPRIVRSVMSEEIDKEELGGAKAHARISGVCDFRLPSEQECMLTIRKLLSYLPLNCHEQPPVVDTGDDPDRLDDTIADVVPMDPRKGYDVRKVIAKIVDNGDYLEVKPEFAPEIVTAFGRLEGHTVGMIASQPKSLSGALTCDSSRKEARFIRFCDAFNIPLVMLVDTTAYTPGSAQEHNAIIHHGAKIVYAFCEATVPRIAVTLRKIYGGGVLGMGVDNAIGTDTVFAWPTTETGIMGAKESVALFHGEEIKNSANPEELRQQLLKKYQDRYGDPFAGASIGRFNIEHIIEPRETRLRLIRALRLFRHKNIAVKYPKKHGNIPL
jgi:methylmalonyl-CoA decarboxylase subunit alpha